MVVAGKSTVSFLTIDAKAVCKSNRTIETHLNSVLIQSVLDGVYWIS